MESRFYHLATKVISGEANAAEQEELDVLLAENVEYKQEFKGLEQAWNSSGELELESFASEDWGKLQARLNQPKAKQGKVVSMNRWLSIAASISLIALTSFLIWNSMKWEHITADNKDLEIQLPDKSVVTLRAGSSLSYHYRFAENRKIELAGEAFFEVTKDQFHPFVIQSGKTDIKVLGTAFNVDTRKGISTEVHVKEGRVQFGHEEEQIILKAGDAARYSVELNSLDTIDFGTGNRVDWMKQSLQFDNELLATTLADIEHYFGITIIAEEANLSCGFTGKFNEPELESVFKTLERTLGLEFEQIYENTWKLKSGGCE